MLGGSWEIQSQPLLQLDAQVQKCPLFCISLHQVARPQAADPFSSGGCAVSGEARNPSVQGPLVIRGHVGTLLGESNLWPAG